MGLPIAVGTKSVSSYSLPAAQPLEEFADDGTVLYPSLNKQPENDLPPATTVQHAVSLDQRLQAVVVVHYYDMIRKDNDSKEYTVAELHVQISPAGEPFSCSEYRTALHRIRLPQVTEAPLPPSAETRDDDQTEASLPVQLIVDFSCNGRFLACLIPHPAADHQQSVTAVFQLRRPLEKSQTAPPRPALPAYISVAAESTTSSSINTIPVATNPRLVQGPDGKVCMNGTSLCGTMSVAVVGSAVDKNSGLPPPPVLLIACRSGTMVVASYRALIATALHPPVEDENASTQATLTSMQHIARDAGVQGRLIALTATGRAVVWDTVCISATQLQMQELELDQYAAVGDYLFGIKKHVATVSTTALQFSAARWISESHVALLETPTNNCSSVVCVWAVSSDTDSVMERVATLDLTLDQVQESAHTAFCMGGGSGVNASTDDNGDGTSNGESVGLVGTIGIEYDAYSGCLAISSVLIKGGGVVDGKACLQSTARRVHPFVCLWDWRTNTQGLTVAPSEAHPNNYVGGNFEVAWRESTIPSAYVSACGPPVLAATGRRWARCTAIAAERGICSVDCSASAPGRAFVRPGKGRNVTAPDESKRSTSRLHPKWHLFGNEAEEKSFRVLGMQWWEGCGVRDVGVDERFSDDVLVAIIEVDEGKDKGCYLAAWSHRMLDANHQLLRPSSDSMLRSCWGIRLPESFSPTCLDVLELPEILDAPENNNPVRKAVILLSDSSATTQYQVFQMHVFARKSERATSYSELKSYAVIARCSATGCVGYGASLFLAGAYFGFDLHPRKVERDFGENKVERIATFGVIGASGGSIDAMVASSDGIVSTKRLIKPGSTCHGPAKSTELSSYWMTDIVRNETVLVFAWILQLGDGRLLCWTVPCFADATEASALCRVTGEHEKESEIAVQQIDSARASSHDLALLGRACSAGSTSTWMQQSTTGTQCDFSMGCVPGSSFGCILSAGQTCRKLHRSLRSDLERELFRVDFLDHDLLGPSDFVLSPPAYIASSFSAIRDTVERQSATHDIGEDAMFYQSRLMRPNEDPFHDSTMMALQLLVLRSVERAASGSIESEDTKEVYCTMVDNVKLLTTPLQFATMFIEVGRQIEPSLHPYLFPLPRRSAIQGSCTTTEEIFDLLLQLGSVSMPVASLPLFTERDMTRSRCAAVFHYCLDVLDTTQKRGNVVRFDVFREERGVIGDVFRYGLKLEDPEDDDDDSTKSFTTDSTGSNDEERKGYSLMCGLSRFFGKGRPKADEQAIIDAASSFIVHGFDDHLIDEHLDLPEPTRWGRSDHHTNTDPLDRDAFGTHALSQTVAGVTARYLLTVFAARPSQDTPGHPSSWKLAGETAALLIGESLTGFHFCTRKDFLSLLDPISSSDLTCLLPTNQRHESDFVSYLAFSIHQCERDIDRSRASSVLNLVLILLARHGESRDLATEIPGLVVVAVVAGHASGRMMDLLSDDQDSALAAFYLEARFELAKLQSTLA